MTDQGYRLFYRIALTNPTTLYDYQSAKERGATEPRSPARLAVWDGLSVYSTLNQARRKQRISPMLGSYIAALRVPTDGSIRFMRTLGGDGHHTIWGPATALRRLEVSVEPAEQVN
jgi:hypothetical protein